MTFGGFGEANHEACCEKSNGTEVAVMTASTKTRPGARPVLDHASLRVAIAHEWLVRYAGSERCVHEMLEAFPGAELLTTIVKPSALPAALSPRMVPAPDAALLAAPQGRARRRPHDFEQPRLCEGGSGRARDATPVLLPHAHALRMALRLGTRAIPAAGAPAGTDWHALVQALGSEDG